MSASDNMQEARQQQQCLRPPIRSLARSTVTFRMPVVGPFQWSQAHQLAQFTDAWVTCRTTSADVRE